jgi:hypothetical protein
MTREKFDLNEFAAKALELSRAYIHYPNVLLCLWGGAQLFLPTHTHTWTGVYLTAVEDFRAVRRKLPEGSIFNLQYEKWLNEDVRLSVLGRLVDFIGAYVSI